MPEELEDDVAELVCRLANEVAGDLACMCNAPTEAAKQQLRDALNKLIDERLEAALRRVPLGEGFRYGG